MKGDEARHFAERASDPLDPPPPSLPHVRWVNVPQYFPSTATWKPVRSICTPMMTDTLNISGHRAIMCFSWCVGDESGEDKYVASNRVRAFKTINIADTEMAVNTQRNSNTPIFLEDTCEVGARGGMQLLQSLRCKLIEASQLPRIKQEALRHATKQRARDIKNTEREVNAQSRTFERGTAHRTKRHCAVSTYTQKGFTPPRAFHVHR